MKFQAMNLLSCKTWKAWVAFIPNAISEGKDRMSRINAEYNQIQAWLVGLINGRKVYQSLFQCDVILNFGSIDFNSAALEAGAWNRYQNPSGCEIRLNCDFFPVDLPWQWVARKFTGFTSAIRTKMNYLPPIWKRFTNLLVGIYGSFNEIGIFDYLRWNSFLNFRFSWCGMGIPNYGGNNETQNGCQSVPSPYFHPFHKNISSFNHLVPYSEWTCY